MGKIAIIYKSKHGTTKQYAQWISEETGADIFDVDNCKVEELMDYDTIVFGGYIRAGGLQGIDFLQKNYGKLKQKTILAYAVGINVDGIDSRQECRDINFKKNLSEIPCYFFRGAYHPENIKGMDKMIMGLMKRLMNGSNQELYHAVTHGVDMVDRSEIQYLVNAIKG